MCQCEFFVCDRHEERVREIQYSRSIRRMCCMDHVEHYSNSMFINQSSLERPYKYKLNVDCLQPNGAREILIVYVRKAPINIIWPILKYFILRENESIDGFEFI